MAAQQGANPSDQLTSAERLGQVIVGADFEADDEVDLFGSRREHEYWHRGGVANAP